MRAKNFTLFDTPETSTVITGRARFADEHTILVSAGTDRLTVRAATIVINTGAEPALPPIPGLADSTRVVTSTGMLALGKRPGELVILGGGYVGVEFASMQAAYGTRVTILQRGDRLLPQEDAGISAEIRTLLTTAGVQVLTGATARQVSEDGDRIRVGYRSGSGGTDSVEGDLVLAALGRRPVTEGLGLAEAGVAVGPRGEIVVNDQLQTSVPHIYAVGDVNGGPQFTYVSLDDYRIVLDQLVGDGSRTIADRTAVPHVVFTTPPLARVGLTEAQARATGRPLKTATRRIADMATVPRAKIVGEARGVATAIVDAETDEVFGVTILAHDAHELINTIAVAMRLGATATALRDGIYTHPSMTELFSDLFANLR